MRIALNCRSILKQNATGIGRYTHQLLLSLGKIDTENEYHLYAAQRLIDLKRRLPDFHYRNFYRCNDFFGRGLYQCISKVDVCHIPSPDFLPVKKSPMVVTVHDLIYKTYPKSHPSEAIQMLEAQMREISTIADHIICISQATREDLHRFYDIPLTRTSVIYNGVNQHTFYPLSNASLEEARKMALNKGIDRPYILFVGTIEPRKNLHGILKAFALLRQKTKFSGYLVVVGMKGWMVDHIGSLIKDLGLTEAVRFLGYVTDDELRELYNMAKVFVFPSYYEGFGFPIIEAFACGVPVITSNTSSCVEIAGDNALTIDPADDQAISYAMGRIIGDDDLQKRLISKGLNRAQGFSFDKMAKETLGVYQQVRKNTS